MKALWAAWPASLHGPVACERVLPTGDAHLVFLLGEDPLLLHDPITGDSRRLSRALVGGPRATPYVKDVSRRGPSVGAELRPGAVPALFGVPANVLAGDHFPLRDLWGSLADEALERLSDEPHPDLRLDLLERILLDRLPRVRALHPAVARAIEAFAANGRVSEVVADTGYSHRHFNDLFARCVGLKPKVYCRVRRFQSVLAEAMASPLRPWADLAQAAGFADQAHLTREFGELAGVTPGEWRRAAPVAAHHVPILPPVA